MLAALRSVFFRFDYKQIIPMIILLLFGVFFVYGIGQQVGGEVRIYRLDKVDPERVWPYKVKDTYMLGDMYRNIVEG